MQPQTTRDTAHPNWVLTTTLLASSLAFSAFFLTH